MRLFLKFLMVFLLVPTLAGAVDAGNAYHERLSMLLIGKACNALEPTEYMALQTGQLQARGALLRGGYSAHELAQMKADLTARAERISCTDERVVEELARIRSAAAVWQHLYEMQFPARWQSWTARRDEAREKARWRVRSLLHTKAGYPVLWGLSAHGAAVFLDVVVIGGKPPASVVLHMRDGTKLDEPLSPDMLRLMGRASDSITDLAPPKSVQKSYFAMAEMAAPPSLVPLEIVKDMKRKDRKSVLFRFSADALAAFSALDPRDIVSVELIYPARRHQQRTHETLFAEAGDFQAARLFSEAVMLAQESAPGGGVESR